MDKKEIRIVDSKYNELFRIPDGGKIKINYSNNASSVAICEYIDDYHVRISGDCYHILQFSQMMEREGFTLEPYVNDGTLDKTIERTVFAEITIYDSLAEKQDLGTCDYLEEEWEASGIEENGIYLDRYVMAEYDSTSLWERYINYLIDWAFARSDESYEGMSPACFDEWKECEDNI